MRHALRGLGGRISLLSNYFRSSSPTVATLLEKWLHVPKFGELYERGVAIVPEALAQEEGIEMALDAMRKASASEQVRELIEMREKASHDWATSMEDAEQKGVEKGRQEGRQEGRLEGRLEERVELARRMRQAGVPLEMLLKVTGLRPEDVDE